MPTLFPSQVEGAKFLAERKHALLADPMGFGKCAQAIHAAELIYATSILVICPASVRETWRREFNKFSNEPRNIQVVFKSQEQITGDVVIMSYEGAVKYKNRLMQRQWDLLIGDESHFVKNITTKRTQAFYGFKHEKGLVHYAARTWLLSGTPMPNHPFELYPMCRVLFPDSFKLENGKAMDRWAFTAKFCKVENNGFGDRIMGGKNLSDLQQRLQPHMLRRKKESRPALEEILPLAAHDAFKGLKDTELQQLMAEVEDRLNKAASDKERAAILERIDDKLKARLRRLLGLAKVEPMAEWVKDRLEGGLEKIVLFAHHTDVLHGLRGLLSDVSQIAYIDGSTAPTQRDAQVQLFRNNPNFKVFLGQLQAAGTGVDGLQVASELVLVEYDWTATMNDQVKGRIDRTGQSGMPLIWWAVLSGSLDERIAQVAARKDEEFKQVFV